MGTFDTNYHMFVKILSNSMTVLVEFYNVNAEYHGDIRLSRNKLHSPGEIY